MTILDPVPAYTDSGTATRPKKPPNEAERTTRRSTSMNELTYPEHFNPSPDSTGFVLFEHWETTGADEYSLMNIAATPLGMTLKPGDWIIRRRWAPAAEPVLYNRARPDRGAR